MAINSEWYYLMHASTPTSLVRAAAIVVMIHAHDIDTNFILYYSDRNLTHICIVFRLLYVKTKYLLADLPRAVLPAPGPVVHLVQQGPKLPATGSFAGMCNFLW